MAEGSTAKFSAINSLKSQVRDLQAKIQHLTVKEQVSQHIIKETIQTPVPQTDLEVHAQREQVIKLQDQLTERITI